MGETASLIPDESDGPSDPYVFHLFIIITGNSPRAFKRTQRLIPRYSLLYPVAVHTVGGSFTLLDLLILAFQFSMDECKRQSSLYPSTLVFSSEVPVSSSCYLVSYSFHRLILLFLSFFSQSSIRLPLSPRYTHCSSFSIRSVNSSSHFSSSCSAFEFFTLALYHISLDS